MDKHPVWMKTTIYSYPAAKAYIFNATNLKTGIELFWNLAWNCLAGLASILMAG